MSDGAAPPREVVTATPRRPAARRASPGSSDLYESGGYGQALLASLIRAQLAVTLSILTPAAAVLAIYPLVSVLLPGLAAARVGPWPLTLVVLGGGIYPPLVLLGFLYVRRARRVEQRFVDLLKDR